MSSALDALDPTLERSFRGHKGPVSAVSFSPTLKQLASGAADGCVMIWNFRPQLRAFRFVGHKAEITSVAFSPDAKLLASASKDHTVRVWQPTVHGESVVMRGHTSTVRAVDWTYDSRTLLTASDDKTIKLWSMPSRRFKATLSGHSHWVRSAAFSPDARLVASGSDDKTVRLWDAECKTTIHTFFEHTSPVLTVQFSPDGTCVAAGDTEGGVNVWDVRSRRLIQHYAAHTGAAHCIRFHPSGAAMYSAGEDAAVKIWDVREGRLMFTLQGHGGAVSAVDVAAIPAAADGTGSTGSYFASGGDDSLVMVWRSNFDTPPGVSVQDDVLSPPANTGSRAATARTRPSTAHAPGGPARPQRSTAPADGAATRAPLRERSQPSAASAPRVQYVAGGRSSMSTPEKPAMHDLHARSTVDSTAEAHDDGGPPQRPHLQHTTLIAEDRKEGVGAAAEALPTPARAAASAAPVHVQPAPQPATPLSPHHPEGLVLALQRVVGQMDLLTRTVALVEQRLALQERRLDQVISAQLTLAGRMGAAEVASGQRGSGRWAAESASETVQPVE